MKSLIKFLFVLIPLLSTAQNVEDFAKVRIPSAFSGFDDNQYQMNQYLRLLLKQKGYEVLSGNEKKEQQLYDPCEMLFVDVKDESSWFRTKLNVEFRDCRDQLIAHYIGNTKLKELKEGHIDALKDAVNQIGAYNGNAYSSNVTNDENTEVLEEDKNFAEKFVDGVKDAADVVVNEVKSFTQSDDTDAVFTDGFREYELVKKEKVISLKDLSSKAVFATFYPTRSDDVYQVKFDDDSSAVGYLYHDKIILEKYNDQGEKQELVLKRK